LTTSTKNISATWLLRVPRDYLDFTAPKMVFPEPDGEKHYFLCRLKEMVGYTKSGTETTEWKYIFRLKITFEDGRSNSASSMIFGAVRPWRYAVIGKDYMLFAKLKYWNDRLQLDNPEIITATKDGKVIPTYESIRRGEKFTADKVRECVRDSSILLDEAVSLLLNRLCMSETEFISLYGVSPLNLLKDIHFPLTPNIGKEAIFIAEKISIDALLIEAEKNRIKAPDLRSVIQIDRAALMSLEKGLPFNLTNDQQTVINEIVTNLESSLPMRRILSGDVGTGKSIAFMLPAAAVFKSGKNCAFMTPNQLLVTQLAREMREFFPEVLVQEIRPGKNIDMEKGIVIGTTSVIFAAERSGTKFDFIVTDEQHKFSVEQKALITQSYTNVLEATATPIPRTTAVLACSGMDLSVIRECPVKKEIQSRIANNSKKNDIVAFLKSIVAKGGQIGIVYPAVFESDKLKSIESSIVKWEKMFPDKISVLHGQMNASSKELAISQMMRGEHDVIVSSTAIELGVTLPALKLMLVIHPEQFGTSQLHQLRGRVARKGGKGYFIMYHPEDISDEAMRRLKAVESTTDGFLLAEKDMEMRGFGDLGTQSEDQTGQIKLLFDGINIGYSRVVSLIEERKIHKTLTNQEISM